MIQRYEDCLMPCDDGNIVLYDDHVAAMADALAAKDRRIAELEAQAGSKDAEMIKLAENFIQFVWEFRPDCWDALDELEALLSKLTGVPEEQINRKWYSKRGQKKWQKRLTKQ